jgi:nucleotide-binding universal stress UspA family protein
VPRAAAGAGVDHIVVGTDGSAGSAAAAQFCAELAAALAVPVTAVLAEDPFLEWVPESDPRGWRHHAAGQVREWVAPIAAAGVAVNATIDRDIHPVAALARATQKRPGSIAVVGARGLGGFIGLRLGRVPLQLVHHTNAAVIVVPAEQVPGRAAPDASSA